MRLRQSRRTSYIDFMARKTVSTRSVRGKKARVLSSRVVYRGPVFHVTNDQVREPGGYTARRDMIRHSGSVVVMPVEQRGKEPHVLLVRQYRHAAGQDLWELSAGRIDPGEETLAGAKRELEEETGFRAAHWKRILLFYSSPGFLDETMAVFMATDLQPGPARPEEDEVISKRFFPLSSALRMVRQGRIKDGKTIAGVLYLAAFPPSASRS